MKRHLPIRTLLPAVTGMMTIVLVTICALYALDAKERDEVARRVPAIVDMSNDLFEAVQNFRIERGVVNSAIASPEIVNDEFQKNIDRVRNQSGRPLASAMAKLSTARLTGTDAILDNIRAKRAAHAKLRLEVDAALKMPSEERPPDLREKWVTTSADMMDAVDRLSERIEGELNQSDPFISKMLRLKNIAWWVRANSGEDRLIVRDAVIERKSLSEAQRLQLAASVARTEGVWKLILDEASVTTTPPRLKEAILNADKSYFTEFRAKRDAIVADLSAVHPISLSPVDWFNLSIAGRQSLFMVGKTAFDLASVYATEQATTARWHFFAAVFFMAVFSIIGILTAYYVVRGVVSPITRIAETMRVVAEGDLSREIPFRDRADEIGSLARALHIFRDYAIENQQLHLAKIGAETANRTKSEFLANMSHELRTPLNAIIGFADVIKLEMFGPLSTRYKGYANDIFNSGKHLLLLINEILDLSKLEAGQFELSEEDIDLSLVVEACVHMVEPLAAESKVTLSKTIARILPQISADDRRIRQVLLNLLSNAVKFTPEGGRVDISVSRRPEGIVMTVSDTGIGMTPEQIPKALLAFRQIDSKVSRKHVGTGLGLPLAKHLVELHGGSLTITSTIDVGTTVTVVLPPHRILTSPPLLTAAVA